MPYYPDLSKHLRHPNFLRVGWLSGKHSFETSRPAKWVIEKLWAYCEHSILPAGGFHQCNLPDCRGPFRKVKIRFDGRRPSARQLKEEHDSELQKLLMGPLSRFSAEQKKEFIAELNEDLKDALRGHSKMTLGVHPVTRDRIELGYAQIFVFGRRGKIYDAPNMIYHYVTVHHYKPPEEFIKAIKRGPNPPNPEYFDMLQEMGLLMSRKRTIPIIRSVGKSRKSAQRRRPV
jgi:hypothetical protein